MKSFIKKINKMKLSKERLKALEDLKNLFKEQEEHKTKKKTKL